MFISLWGTTTTTIIITMIYKAIFSHIAAGPIKKYTNVISKKKTGCFGFISIISQDFFYNLTDANTTLLGNGSFVSEK